MMQMYSTTKKMFQVTYFLIMMQFFIIITVTHWKKLLQAYAYF